MPEPLLRRAAVSILAPLVRLRGGGRIPAPRRANEALRRSAVPVRSQGPHRARGEGAPLPGRGAGPAPAPDGQDARPRGRSGRGARLLRDLRVPREDPPLARALS